MNPIVFNFPHSSELWNSKPPIPNHVENFAKIDIFAPVKIIIGTDPKNQDI